MNLLQAQQQKRDFDLSQPPFSVTYTNRNQPLSAIYAAGQDTIALKWAWTSQRMRKMTYAQFRTLPYGNACLLEAAWWGDDKLVQGQYVLNAFNHAKAPQGKYLLRTNTMAPRGGLVGMNSFGNYDQPDPNYRDYVTTEFVMDDANWIDCGETERHAIDSPNAHLAGTNDQSYSEGFELRNIRITGPFIFNDTKVRVGAFLRRLGSASRVDNVHVSGFYDGVVFNGGVTPTVGVICPFDNERCGVGMIGSALATVNIATIEGDRNNENFGMHAGYGSPAGGNTIIGMLKIEDGGAGTGPSVSPNQVWRGTLAAYLEGQYTVTIGHVQCSYSFITVDAPFVVNPTIPEFGPQGSLLNVQGGSGFGFVNLCHDLLHKTYLTKEPNYFSFSFRAWGDGMFKSDRLPEFVQVKASACNKPLGFVEGTNGSISHVTCTPVRNNDPSTGGPVNPPPPPPVDPPPPTSTMTATAFKEDCMEAGSVRVPSFILDGKDNTFWMGCASMTATGSQWVTITLPTAQSLKGLTFTKPIGYNDSWPRTFTVELSANGTSYAAPLKFTGTATGCAATWPAQMVKAARIKCTSAAAGAWWGINTLTVQ